MMPPPIAKAFVSTMSLNDGSSENENPDGWAINQFPPQTLPSFQLCMHCSRVPPMMMLLLFGFIKIKRPEQARLFHCPPLESRHLDVVFVVR